MFARAAGLQLTHVPLQGHGRVMQAMMSGEIPAAVLTVADWGTLQQSGKGRMLAVSSAQRLRSIPIVPTSGRSGYDIEARPGMRCSRRPARRSGRRQSSPHGDRGLSAMLMSARSSSRSACR
jgi:tripartite-type tricarboxylate transporter receptor subunit TctC